jgi:IclR family acetate operon transcriptional repressor
MADPARPASGSAVRSVQRALAALDFLVSAAPGPVRVTDVARHLELSVPSASRLLATLVGGGYASRTPDRRFTVGPRSVLLARHWVARLRAMAAGPIARVSAATGQPVVLDQLLGDSAVTIAWHAPPSQARHVVAKLAEFAPSYPLWATATGRAMLGKLAPAQRARLVPPEPYPRLTGRTTTTWHDLRHAVRAGEKSGLHVEHGEADPDLWCSATALERGPAGEVLAIAVISFGEPGARQRSRILSALRRESHQLDCTLAMPAGPAPAATAVTPTRSPA